MADFAPHASDNREQENASDIERNTRYGLRLFTVYLLLYLGYILLSTFTPKMMQDIKIAGVNLSVMYGFGLIIAAWVLALIYGWLCRDITPADSTTSTKGGAA
ncbi:hypothetical protein Pla110_24240 [Polystyrenella longa]|uniref:Inner membrane protein YjcH n=1 Tax=Polystyrenella longa TaxID=2528007 RepID=A0A518CN85_9PLAN|nr:DUF485 domain-containing protein [Polystyrenella longa]QDU80692.1 hypothetical protein Pla110_24240 [Polystyrenella longa]